MYLFIPVCCVSLSIGRAVQFATTRDGRTLVARRSSAVVCQRDKETAKLVELLDASSQSKVMKASDERIKLFSLSLSLSVAAITIDAFWHSSADPLLGAFVFFAFP